MENNEQQAPQGEQTTTENLSEETQQQQASQPDGQEETSSRGDSVNDSLKIEKEEIETSGPSTPSIDDIVEEALSGELSPETQKLIDENGLGKHIAMLVEGHKVVQERNDQQIFEAAGGKSSYEELQEWGKNNMSKEEQEAFNAALFSGNLNLAKLAVQGLKAQYVAKNGKSPDKIIEGGGSANDANRPFSSREDYLKITQTFEYKNNPEYRNQIEAKRNKSGF